MGDDRVLRDEDITTTWMRGGGVAGTSSHTDPDSTDPDGTDADGTDSDSGGSDSDSQDS